MALAPRSGTPGPAPIQNAPAFVSTVTALDQAPMVKDTFINRTALNPTTYADEFKMLQGYLRGARIQVTYFMNASPLIDRLTDTVDHSTVQNTIHTSYTHIRNFELTLTEQGLQTAYNGDNNETRVTGEAMTYPGTEPRKGDIFLYKLGDNQIGKFQVSDIERLSFRQGSNFKITFYLTEYATESSIQLLIDSATRTVVFDKETYLGDATTLLEEDSYIYLKTLRGLRGVIIGHYFRSYYDNIMATVVDKNGTYDPYLVTWLLSRISIEESRNRPSQIYASMINYEYTIWDRLNDRFATSLEGLQSEFDYLRFRPTRLNAGITPLMNRTFVSIVAKTDVAAIPDSDPTSPSFVRPTTDSNYRFNDVDLEYVHHYTDYVLSANFYSGNVSLMNEFEHLVYTAIKTKKINNIKTFIETYLNNYTSLDANTKFYRIPLYIYLIDTAISQLTKTR